MVHLGSVTFAFLSGHLEGRNSQKMLINASKFDSKCNIYISENFSARKNKDNMNNALERATKIRKGKTGVGSYSF